MTQLTKILEWCKLVEGSSKQKQTDTVFSYREYQRKSKMWAPKSNHKNSQKNA